MSTLQKPVFVFASDIHINSKQAVSVEKIDLGEGDWYYQNKIQAALQTAWKDAWQEVKSRAGKRPIVTCFGGEIIDMDSKNRSDQYITRDEAIAQDHAMELLTPALEMSSKIIALRGTEAHTGVSGKIDEAIAKRIHKEYKNVHKNADAGTYSWHYFRGHIGGRSFDLAHHVNMGASPRTERNAANHLAADLMMSYARWKEPLPDFAFRGHVHRFDDSSFNYPIRACISGCWQVATPYIHRIGQGATCPEIGMLYCDPITKQVERIYYDYKRETPEHI